MDETERPFLGPTGRPVERPALPPSGRPATLGRERDAPAVSGGGRHLRRREARRGSAGRWVLVAVAVLALLGGLVAVIRLTGAAGDDTPRTAATVPPPPPTEAAAANPSREPPPGSGVFGNLVLNWSFEEDLRGWSILGPAEGSREAGGHTSGSSARITATGPGTIGLAVGDLARNVPAGKRYAAVLWVRSSSPGTAVTASLVSRSGGTDAASKVSVKASTSDTRWTRVRVSHQVPKGGSDLRFQLTTTGRSLVVDEVTVSES
jgi:hypothetical protein